MRKVEKGVEIFMLGREVCKRYRINRTTLWHWTRDGKFPQPLRAGRACRWSVNDLLAWERAQGISA